MKRSARSTVRSIARLTKEGASFIASCKEVFPAGVPEPGLKGRSGRTAAKLKGWAKKSCGRRVFAGPNPAPRTTAGEQMVKILEVDSLSPRVEAIAEAAATIRTGGLVVYPTETVYGLGADACSNEAVAKVFVTKTRPLEDPIPVAVNSLELAHRIAELTPIADLAFKKFLPGPLTLVVKAKPGKISELVTAGTENVGIRVPDHPVALKLIEFVGGPITATSANLSGKPASISLRGALEQLGENVDLALDSGKCKLGKPSTVLDLSSDPPRILREGPISKRELSKILKL